MSGKSCIFAAKFDAKEVIMTALQLNADIYRNMAIIAENESMLKKVAKYISRLAKQATDDPTCMTKEEFFARIDEASKGPSHEMLPNEDLTAFLRRMGHDL
jgi:hypothetical protein